MTNSERRNERMINNIYCSLRSGIVDETNKRFPSYIPKQIKEEYQNKAIDMLVAALDKIEEQFNASNQEITMEYAKEFKEDFMKSFKESFKESYTTALAEAMAM